MNEIPSTMRAVLLRDYKGGPESITVAEVPVPQPGRGQVLVQIAAAPMNPSDLAFIKGFYGFRKSLPTIPGFEGSGTVVGVGSGLMPRYLMGRRVACAAAAPNIEGGTWAQYLVTNAKHCIPLNKEVSMEQGASLLINPMTAWGLLEQARKSGYRAVVQSAAAGALGRMIIRLAQRFSIATINIVRRPEQEELLRGMGAEHVLNENTAEFDEALKDLCHTLDAGIGFDAVAGEMSGRILRAQPRGSLLLVYGLLSLKPSQIDPALLIFERKRVEGFWLSSWLNTKHLFSQRRILDRIQKLIPTDLSTAIQARLPLEDFVCGLAEYKNHMTKGKVLLQP
jgi:NADPH2:quinone reductase